MAFIDVIDSVLSITGRVDKDLYIRSIVNPVSRSIASVKDHPSSLVEAKLVVSNTLLIHTLPLPALFRKVAYLKPAPWPKFLMPIEPRQGVTQGREAVNVYYQSGSNLVVSLGAGYQTSEFAFGYYSHPALLVADADTNWVLDNYQDLIIDLCAAKVLRVTGDAKGASTIEAGVAIQLAELTNSSSGAAMVMGA